MSKIKDNFKNNFLPKLKAALKKYLSKQVLTIIGIILLIAALGFGGVKIYDYSRTAYLKPYIEKYNIEFPEGILEEMCDLYGSDQSVCGKLYISDIAKEITVYKTVSDSSAYIEKGANIQKDQHFRAIRLSKKAGDIESIYSTSQLFLKSSQEIELTTLFDKEAYKVVAAFYTNTNPKDDNGYVFPYNYCGNMSQKDFEAYEDRIIHRTLYKTDYEFSPDDYFLTLSAPSDFMDDFRFVIVCVKADKNGVQKSKTAVPNEKIHFPQVWYDANNEENPYIFAGKWYPKAI